MGYENVEGIFMQMYYRTFHPQKSYFCVSTAGCETALADRALQHMVTVNNDTVVVAVRRRHLHCNKML